MDEDGDLHEQVLQRAARRTGVGRAAEDPRLSIRRHRRAVEADGQRSPDELAVLADSFFPTAILRTMRWKFFKAASIAKSPRSPGIAQQETDNVTYRNVTGRHPKKKMRRATPLLSSQERTIGWHW
jgi:hypothetical protein